MFSSSYFWKKWPNHNTFLNFYHLHLTSIIKVIVLSELTKINMHYLIFVQKNILRVIEIMNFLLKKDIMKLCILPKWTFAKLWWFELWNVMKILFRLETCLSYKHYSYKKKGYMLKYSKLDHKWYSALNNSKSYRG